MNWLSDAQTEQTASTEMGPADAAERRDAAGVAFTLLGRLPNNQQEVIRLKVENGMSYREISDVTGLSVSNVGYLIHQGVKTLREQFTRLQSTA